MPKKIIFLLGSANISGGTYVILQHASYLANAGFDVTVGLVYMTMKDFEHLKKSTDCWHPAIQTLHFKHVSACENIKFDIAIYTWWATLFSFHKISAKASVYFVQSIESKFYPEHRGFLKSLVDKTYQLNLPVITEATWIKEYLAAQYQSQVFLAKNGILKHVYQPDGKAKAVKEKGKLRVLVEGPLDAPYKNVARTIEICQRASIDEIWLLTSSAVQSYPGVNQVYSQVSIAETAEIYRSCDVLVKLSFVEGMFGPPLEIFHCGDTAIVYAVTGHDEYIAHHVNALVAAPNDEETVIQYLQSLKTDERLLNRLQLNAAKTAQAWMGWDEASENFTQQLLHAAAFSPQQEKIANTISQLFSQKLIVKTQVQDHIQTHEIHAQDLEVNGHYLLSIPLPKGKSSSSICFGKSYHQFNVVNIFFPPALNDIFQGSLNLDAQGLTQAADKTLTCGHEDAALILHTQIDQLTDHHHDCYVNLQFEVIN